MRFKKWLVTLGMLAALGIGSSSCTAAEKNQVTPPDTRLEYRIDDFAKIQKFGNPNSDKTVYYIPQVHLSDNESKESLSLLIDCQIDIYNVINDLNQNYNVDLLAIEGNVGEVDYKDLIISNRKRNAEIRANYSGFAEEKIKNAIIFYNTVNAGLKYEMTARDRIITIGVDDEDFNTYSGILIEKKKKLLDEMFESLDGPEEDTEEIKNRLANINLQISSITVKQRSQIAVNKVMEHMDKYNLDSSILVYGGFHTASIIEAFGNKTKLYVIKLESYKKVEDKINKGINFKRYLRD